MFRSPRSLSLDRSGLSVAGWSSPAGQARPGPASPARRSSGPSATGVRFLKEQQRADGSWPEVEAKAHDRDDQPGHPGPADRRREARLADDPASASTSSAASARSSSTAPMPSALQTMVFAAAEPERDRLRIVANVEWLERAQIKPGDRMPWPGSWTYSDSEAQRRRQLEHPVRPAGPERRQRGRRPRQARGLGARRAPTSSGPRIATAAGPTRPRHKQSTASMTCAGISSLIITGSRRFQGLEYLQGETIHDCGKGGFNRNLHARDRLAGQPLPGRPELRPRPAVEISTTSTAWSGPAGSPASGSSARTTGIAWAPRSWSTIRTSSPGSGAGPARRTSWSRPASRCCSWPRAARRS